MKRPAMFILLLLISAHWPLSQAHAQVKKVDNDIALLLATQQTFRDVAASMKSYLVRIDTVGGTQPGAKLNLEGDDKEGQKRLQNPFRDTLGSGFVIADGPATGIVYSHDGYILTSSFNFAREPVLITVTLPDGRRLAADLIARDYVRKLALLKVDANDLPLPTWRQDSDVQVGEWAITLGLGFGGHEPSVTVGVISALNRMQGNAIQTDAKLSPANYGGPVCDVFGRVIGIAVPMAQRAGELAGVDMYDCGVGFLVPLSRINLIVPQLMAGVSFQRGWLGIQVNSVPGVGVVVRSIANPSPMRNAGALPGDIIEAINGVELRNYADLAKQIYMIPAGQALQMRLSRDGGAIELSVPLASAQALGTLPEAEEPFDPSVPVEEKTPEDQNEPTPPSP